jgi:hypothetical protein
MKAMKTMAQVTGRSPEMTELYQIYLVEIMDEAGKQYGFVKRCHVRFLYRAHEAGF